MGEKVLMKGNEAIGEAAIRSGCRHFFGYPITPQTELSAYMAKKMPKINGVFLQAESEVSAINMVYGAAAAGMRTMTSSSSPGISLKAEGISYLAAGDLPCVIVNIVRGGPGLGGIQPAQSDYFQAVKGGGHGDYHLIVLAPNSVQELAHLTAEAFNISDEYRIPTMILGDGTLGQMMEPVDLDAIPEPIYADKPWAARGTDKSLREEGIKVGVIRPITLWPFPEKIFKTVKPKAFLSVEMSTGQMIEDIKLACECSAPVYFCGRTGGIILTPDEVAEKVKSIMKEVQ